MAPKNGLTCALALNTRVFNIYLKNMQAIGTWKKKLKTIRNFLCIWNISFKSW